MSLLYPLLNFEQAQLRIACDQQCSYFQKKEISLQKPYISGITKQTYQVTLNEFSELQAYISNNGKFSQNYLNIFT